VAQLEEIKVPNIGDFSSVEIIEISVKVGDTVEVEDTLITLETEKAAMEVPSPLAGTIKALTVSEGDKVSEGDIILTLEINDDLSPSQPEIAAVTEVADEAKEPPKAAAPQAKIVEDIIIPDLGTDDQVEVIEVSVSVGDTIEEDDALITLESEKASMEVPATKAGKVLEVYLKVGDKVATGDAVLQIETQALSTKSPVQPVKENTAQPVKTSKANDTPKPITPASTGLAHAGPATRRLANQLGVDLTKVSGSGRKGRVLTTDIHQYVKSIMQSGGAPQASTGLSIEPMPEVDFSKWGDIKVEPVKRIKKFTAKNLHRNWVNIPHVTNFDEADITDMENFRQKNKAQAEKKGAKLTPLVFIMKALVSGLKEFPSFNSSLSNDGQELILKQYFHIGVAVDTPDGLVVPVIRDVDKKGIYDLAQELGEVSKKARDGKLTLKEMQGGCISISSLGGIGGTNFTPIVNAPEVAILGVSRSTMKPVYNGESFEPRLVLPLARSYDHRVIGGVEAARVLAHMRAKLSDIRKLLL